MAHVTSLLAGITLMVNGTAVYIAGMILSLGRWANCCCSKIPCYHLNCCSSNACHNKANSAKWNYPPPNHHAIHLQNDLFLEVDNMMDSGLFVQWLYGGSLFHDEPLG